MKRRDFNKAMLAAVGGIVAGSTLGCASNSDQGKEVNLAHLPPHACKGMNECKGQGGCGSGDTGGAGKNTCKGKGGCATRHNECKGKNACKGLGGCKSGDAGCYAKNSCKGKGGCKVPGKASCSAKK